MTDHRCDLASAIADHCALDGELVSEFLMLVSTVGEDGSAGSYRVVVGPSALPLHSRIGLMDVLQMLMDENVNGEMGGEDD